MVLIMLEHVKPIVVSIVWILHVLHYVQMHVLVNVLLVLIHVDGNVVLAVQNVLHLVVWNVR